MAGLIAIVVPVFNALDETRRCLDSIMATVPDDQPVIVIDDASTESGIHDLMDTLPQRWVRVTNRTNLGFVGSANLGLSLSSPADVVLLNSDTRVTTGWLEAMVECAESDHPNCLDHAVDQQRRDRLGTRVLYSQPLARPPGALGTSLQGVGPAPVSRGAKPASVFVCSLRRRCLDDIGAF